MVFTINLNISGLSDLFGLGVGILRKLERLIEMSGNTQSAVDRVAADVASLKAEVQTDVAAVATQVSDLKKQIADLQAAGSGATAEQIASLDASAAGIEETIKALHDGLNPPAP